MQRDQILDRLRERIVRFAASRIGAGQAEDVAQDVLIVLHEKYPGVEAMEELVPLSMQIARWKLMAARRKLVRRGEHTQTPVDELPLPSGDADPAEQAEQAEAIARVERALASLGERCRKIFCWKLEGLTFGEIRDKLEVGSINTIYTWDFRCRQQLKERMEADAGAPRQQVQATKIIKTTKGGPA